VGGAFGGAGWPGGRAAGAAPNPAETCLGGAAEPPPEASGSFQLFVDGARIPATAASGGAPGEEGGPDEAGGRVSGNERADVVPGVVGIPEDDAGGAAPGAASPPGGAFDRMKVRAPTRTTSPPPKITRGKTGTFFPPAGPGLVGGGPGTPAGAETAWPQPAQNLAVASRLAPHLGQTVVLMVASVSRAGSPDGSCRAAGRERLPSEQGS